MMTGLVVINFGEPPEPTLDRVVPFLERIFLQNAGLERLPDDGARRARARELAEERASGLVEDYELIGGSPLNAQADAQTLGLQDTLRARGHDVTAYSCFQFTEPFVEEAVHQARAGGMQRIVGLPLYPLCGHTTTVSALEVLRSAVEGEVGWDPEVIELSGWHRHPMFYDLHADHTRAFAADAAIDLHDEQTAVLFSIHGTPMHYLEGGSRYDRYVEETCAGIAERLGLEQYHMGYQNHTNRAIAWTRPEVDAVVKGLDARRLVVLPVAFLHEQSETLVELDHDLREVAEARGLDFHRVPVPHDSPRLLSILADMVEAGMGERAGVDRVQLRRCLCRSGGTARCTNGMRLGPEVRPEDERRMRA